MSQLPPPIRERGFADFTQARPEQLQGRRHWLARAQNFWVEWVELPPAGGSFAAESAHELMVLTYSGKLRIAASAGGATAEAPAHSVAILPAGRHTFACEGAAVCVVLASQRPDVAGRRVLNADAYAQPDPRIVPTGTPYRRRQRTGIEVLDIDAVMASRDKPRLKMLQTETLSINIVEYQGARNRAELSPHSHASFEQGSLALAGDFVHHLRAPWGGDADQWREDEHLAAPSPSLLVIPVELIHTTEGVGGGHHFLLDIFSPPRDDFIGKGWVFNADDYEPVRAPQDAREPQAQH